MTQPLGESPRIVPHCSLSTATLVWCASDGRRALTIVSKATYDLRPGISPLAEAQDHVNTGDVHWDGDPRSSLRASTDLVPYKPRVDVLVTGHAYAPKGQSVRSLFARLVVGSLSKTIAVFGDRAFLPGGELSEPAEIDGIPLCWERSAGGIGTANPVGIPHDPFGQRSAGAGAGAERGPSRAPNFQPPEFFNSSIFDPIPPAGFGPIAADWPERAEKLKPHAATFHAADWPSHPLPRGLDAGYFNCAPADQQIDHLEPGVRIVLENLHPEHARLVTHLEGVVPFAVLRREGHEDHRVDLHCDTLWIDADRAVCCLTFRGTIAEEAAEGAEIHVDIESARAASDLLPPAAVTRAAAEHADVTGVEDTALVADGSPVPTATLPPADSVVWIEESSLPSQLRNARAASGLRPPADAARSREAVQVPDIESTLTLSAPVTQTAPLPFGALPAAVTPPQQHLSAPNPTGTIAAALAFDTQALPPAWQRREAPLPVETRAHTPDFVPFATPAKPAPLPPTPPLVAPPAPEIAAEVQEETEPDLDSNARTERPPPPPMLAAVLPVAQPHAQLSDEPTTPITRVIDPATVPLEKWAEITAEMDKALRPKADILRDKDLSGQDFAFVDRHWREKLSEEASRGGFALRLASDGAYVAALERLRGRPLTASEYAKILSAAERLQVPGVLRELDMPPAAHLPIMRLWTLKIARDARLAQEMIQAVAALREAPAGLPATTP